MEEKSASVNDINIKWRKKRFCQRHKHQMEKKSASDNDINMKKGNFHATYNV